MDTDTHALAGSAHPICRAAAHAAAAWGALFSLAHLYWLLGGRIALPAGVSMRDNIPLLVIDIIAIPLCVAAAALALALVRPWGMRLPARLLAVGLWGTTALLLVHAAPSVPDWVGLAAGTRTAADFDGMDQFVTFVYEPFFMAGGLLFALATFGRARLAPQPV